jgi:hypothetical protein
MMTKPKSFELLMMVVVVMLLDTKNKEKREGEGKRKKRKKKGGPMTKVGPFSYVVEFFFHFSQLQATKGLLF